VGKDRAAALAAPGARALVARALAAGPLEIEALGVSMRPWLRPGDRVRLEARAPRHGDVALALVGDRLVLHRLRRRATGRWLLQGDARRAADGWVPAADVLAVAVARSRRGRPGRAPGARTEWRRLDSSWQRWLALGVAPLLGFARTVRR
jgi:hypothetical protein